MIKKEQFYTKDEYPSEKQKQDIWKEINRKVSKERKWIFHINDMRSFYYGIAAAIVMFFVSVGVYTTAKQVMFNMKPEELKLNGAYQSAINEFEKVVPAVASSASQSGSMKGYINSKWEQLRLLDDAIMRLRNETGSSDLSFNKQLRLRQLYVEKLKTLQEIVDRGEIEL